MNNAKVQHPKVVVIGAGSLFFGRQAIWQMVHSPHLNMGTPALVDTDGERLEKMAKLAERTMDFDAAEQERTVRDGKLGEVYAQHLPESTGNLYLMPSGKLINADDALYNPTLIAETPEQAFDDLPG